MNSIKNKIEKGRTCLAGGGNINGSFIRWFIRLKLVYEIDQTLSSVVARPTNGIPRRPQYHRQGAAD